MQSGHEGRVLTIRISALIKKSQRASLPLPWWEDDKKLTF